VRVLVTGAGGFLGRHVVDALLARGLTVRAMVRPGTDLSRFAWREKVELVETDLRTDPHLGSVLSGVDVVVHLAARVSGSDEERFASTVVGTERLLQAMEDHTLRRLVLASSYSVYDWGAIAGQLTEESPVAAHPYDRDSYTVAKVWQEKITREASEQFHFDLVVLRPGFIWGDGNLDIPGLGISVGRCFLVIGPWARPPMTHVDNCAELIALAVESPVAGGRTFNVVDTPAVTSWRWADLLAPQEVRQIRVPVPYRLGLTLVRLVALASRSIFPAGGRLPSLFVPTRFEARFKPLDHSAAPAMESLGWTPKTRFGGVLRESETPPTSGRRTDSRASR
jgi:nucleoside-diphosphate-sugar epimerase